MWLRWGGSLKISHQNSSNWIWKHLNSYQMNNLHAHVQSVQALSRKFLSVKCTLFFVWWNLDVDYMTILMQSQNLTCKVKISNICSQTHWNVVETWIITSLFKSQRLELQRHKHKVRCYSEHVGDGKWVNILRTGRTRWELGEQVLGTHWE